MVFRTDAPNPRPLTASELTAPRPINSADATASITSVTNASQETLNRLAAISAGKQFQAQILSRLNDGTYLARVADTTARMPLPNEQKPGDTITLTLLSASPRPTFVMGESSTAIEESVANMLQNSGSATQVSEASVAGQTRSGQPVEQISSSATATLSATGRFVDNLLHAAQLDSAPNYIRGQAPLMPAPFLGGPEEAATLAQSLQKTIESSGLFYESHVAQWANGQRTLENLLQEPQARMGNMPEPSLFLSPSKNEHSLMDVFRALEVAQQNNTDIQEGKTQNIPLNNETAKLIAQQLNTLENHRIEWQGELWPGKPFEWDVTEEPPQGGGQHENDSSWKSNVRFNMPTLGDISATIHLATNGHVQINIQTSNEDSAELLRNNSESLAQALAAAGSPLDFLAVNRHETE